MPPGDEYWYPRVQRRFRMDRPINKDALILVLTEYTWEQNQAGEVRNQVGKVLTEDGWHEFRDYEILPVDRMPQINGLDIVRGQWIDKKLEDYERWITAMIDFGNSSASDIQDEGHGSQDGNNSPHNVISHDRSVPTVGAVETPEATPADNQQSERTVTDE